MVAALSCEGAAAAQGAGYWHTSGDHILDMNNKQVRIAGIDWYGFESDKAVPGGLYAQDYRTVLQTIKAQGFNTIRLPLSSQMLESPSTGLNIAYYNAAGTAINTDLKGLNSLQVLDSIVTYAGMVGLKVVLDHHRSEAGISAEASGLWFTPQYSEAAWIADWVALAGRYLGNPTVIGFDLHNEPHSVKTGGACWDCGGAADWHLAAERAGNAVLAVNPNLLMFVEGTDVYNGDYYWWGGNLEGVLRSPVVLAEANHLVYSAHDYGPHEAAQSWFNAGTTYSSLSTVWSKHWAYISQNNIAPVWLAEFGTTNDATDIQGNSAGSQGQWFQSLVTFLNTDETINWSYWAVNGEDTYALLDAKYNPVPVNATKGAMLAGMHFPLSTTVKAPSAPTKLTAVSTASSKVGLAWAMVGGSGITFALFFGTGSNNTETVVADGIKATNYEVDNLNASTNYYFDVKAIAAGIASPPSNMASAMTLAAPVPGAPTKLVADAATDSSVSLSWAASSTPGVTYTVYSGSSSSSLKNVVATGVTATTYQADGLNASTGYAFMVKAVAQGVTSGGSNIVSAETEAVPAPSCHVAYSVTKDWGTGFTGAISITNTGTTAVDNWVLSWTYSGNQQVSGSWDGSYTQKGEALAITNASWNGLIGAGATSTGIGLQAAYTGKNPVPTAFFLNGVACK